MWYEGGDGCRPCERNLRTRVLRAEVGEGRFSHGGEEERLPKQGDGTVRLPPDDSKPAGCLVVGGLLFGVLD